ncbi:hypothetical protein JS756_00060 [Streptomyces actuosus]|uniref:Uncharacterized protein n=1 Tax=Streptomyces actuosus TaxID=1885 RepID=A0ABS2VHG6_STRAS|nr:hypothetical protein [Streptomyces actuosus]MBN0042530.1 hypothetical protein [Streptomyces actuosus]
MLKLDLLDPEEARTPTMAMKDHSGEFPPKLVVTYNHRPRTDQQAGPPFFKDSKGTGYVNTLTPMLRDTFADPNNDTVQGFFQIADNTTGTQVGSAVPPLPRAADAPFVTPAGTAALAGRTT